MADLTLVNAPGGAVTAPEATDLTHLYRGGNDAGERDLKITAAAERFWMQRSTTSAISGATAGVNDDNVVYLATVASDYSITLHASPATGQLVMVEVVSVTGTNALTIAGNGKNIIQRGSTQSSVLLYVAGDFVLLQYDGTAWQLRVDGLIPHHCRLSLADDTSTISKNTATKAGLDAAEFNVGGIGDITTNERVDIRRAGNYVITAYVQWRGPSSEVTGDTYIYVDGSTVFSARAFRGTGGGAGLTVFTPSIGFALTAGQYVELYGEHSDNTDRAMAGLSGVADQPTTLEVQEVR